MKQVQVNEKKKKMQKNTINYDLDTFDIKQYFFDFYFIFDFKVSGYIQR